MRKYFEIFDISCDQKDLFKIRKFVVLFLFFCMMGNYVIIIHHHLYMIYNSQDEKHMIQK